MAGVPKTHLVVEQGLAQGPAGARDGGGRRGGVVFLSHCGVLGVQEANWRAELGTVWMLRL